MTPVEGGIKQGYEVLSSEKERTSFPMAFVYNFLVCAQQRRKVKEGKEEKEKNTIAALDADKTQCQAPQGARPSACS